MARSRRCGTEVRCALFAVTAVPTDAEKWSSYGHCHLIYLGQKGLWSEKSG